MQSDISVLITHDNNGIAESPTVWGSGTHPIRVVRNSSRL